MLWNLTEHRRGNHCQCCEILNVEEDVTIADVVEVQAIIEVATTLAEFPEIGISSIRRRRCGYQCWEKAVTIAEVAKTQPSIDDVAIADVEIQISEVETAHAS